MTPENKPEAISDGFFKALSGEDELGVVIRAHIYLEARLLELLGLLVKDEDHLRKLNLEYSQCVDLAVALGFGQEHAKGLRAFVTCAMSSHTS